VKTKSLGRGILVVILILALAVVPSVTAHAQSPEKTPKPAPENRIPTQGQVDGALIGIIAGLVVGAVVVIYLVTRKKTITGCVNSAKEGVTVTNEKDAQIYALAGNTAGITPGDRMKLQGKKLKSTGTDKTLVWETEKVSKDLGACKP